MKTSQIPAVQFTTGNFLLVIAGAVLLGYGLHRMFNIKLNKGFLLLNGPLAVMILVGICILYFGKHQQDSLLKWGQETAKNGSRFIILMVLLCLAMGIGNVIANLHEEGIRTFLSRHPVIGPFFAALLTPTSNALVPIVETAWKDRLMQPMCLYYLIASVMMSVPLFSLRTLGFAQGSEIPGKMYAMGVIISVVLLALMKPTYWLTELLCSWSGSAWKAVQTLI